ncbi:hypothetical protein CAOG_08225 [Capsaspora owczarzaki ATCC 30864]|uniref:Uncharacterized protein n=1 Tax=Capsaspora owczarzaki (strain ATCC 30864) TaxID=595528 RepID=A0A0D2X5Q7_CAPO3|nr:hypothetical protein CAOG_08225 [Capsaspora owczarzaki ATCC 30864]KJE98229.1 hypothetical protein CAOG_008225 [Capsaspora owczarzaki ATCC 30864]|eukprot:XP_004342480.1 hypothetical protein CAOG_08225 [Capsaspora owczarzaki ATCC 30864]
MQSVQVSGKATLFLMLTSFVAGLVVGFRINKLLREHTQAHVERKKRTQRAEIERLQQLHDAL